MHIRVSQFIGEASAIAPHLLPDGAAQRATNCETDSGALLPVKTPLEGSVVAGIPIVDSAATERWSIYCVDSETCDGATFLISDSDGVTYTCSFDVTVLDVVDNSGNQAVDDSGNQVVASSVDEELDSYTITTVSPTEKDINFVLSIRTAPQMATLLAAALNDTGEFTASAAANEVQVTMAADSLVTDPDASDSGFTLRCHEQGTPGDLYIFDDDGNQLTTSMDIASMWLLGDDWILSADRAVESFVLWEQDEDETLYLYVDGSYPKITTTSLAISGPWYDWPADWRRLGVPAPVAAPSVSIVSGSAAAARSTAYVYTYVDEFGHESAPSPASSVIDVAIGKAVAISGIVDATADHLDITHVRIYRVATGSSLNGYLLVPISGGDIPLATAVAGVTDDYANAYLQNGLKSTEWYQPPDALRGITLFNNNTMAGYAGTQVALSTPGYPHAWPYTYEMQNTVYGLGLTNNTLLVVTSGAPATLSGTDPATLQQETLPWNKPCIAPFGVTSVPGGVLYPTENGLFSLPSGDLLTRNLMSDDEWSAQDFDSLHAVYWRETYWAFFLNSRTGWYLPLYGQSPRLFRLSLPNIVRGVTVQGDTLYLLAESGSLGELTIDSFGEGTEATDCTWRSKVWLADYPLSLSCCRVMSSGNVTLTLRVDDNDLVPVTAVPGQIFRLPGGTRGQRLEFTLAFTSRVDQVDLATSIPELWGA